MKVPAKALLFDLDGTLTNTVPLIAGHIAKVLNGRGIVVDPMQVYPYIGQPLETAWAGLAGIETANPECARLSATYRASVQADVEQAGPSLLLPGVKEVLAGLREAQVPVGVVTAKRVDQAEHLLYHARLRGFVDVVVGTDDVEHGKPAPEAALLCAKRLGVAAEDCIMVGDAATDVLMASAAGMLCHAVTTGASDQAQLAEAGAAIVAPDLLALAARWGSCELVVPAQ